LVAAERGVQLSLRHARRVSAATSPRGTVQPAVTARQTTPAIATTRHSLGRRVGSLLLAPPALFLPPGAGGLGAAMKIERTQDEWKLSERATPLGFVREFNGTFWVYRDGDDEPRGYRRLLDAIRSLQPRKPRRSRRVYVRGTLMRQTTEDEDE
jgi:hypothetical protein